MRVEKDQGLGMRVENDQGLGMKGEKDQGLGMGVENDQGFGDEGGERSGIEIFIVKEWFDQQENLQLLELPSCDVIRLNIFGPTWLTAGSPTESELRTS
ncbi:hypothetical protein Pmani_013249 [Petrolisthes manimaculis]|uniref:Uncharacterized protein n=1 Tax=Petrolisthes manimaculis TaxID=1843537 RepID=A0AAE1U9J4_9EUCA|nr:hypothetical protein Pmani_013249 [Petrolisthes manimaculis]